MSTDNQTSEQGSKQEYSNPPGRGGLFQNDKGGVETRPDYRGRMTTPVHECPHCHKEVPGAELRISGWNKRSQGGKRYLSLGFDSGTHQQTTNQQETF